MVGVNLRRFYDAMCTARSINGDKNGAVVVKFKDGYLNVCTAVSNKKYIKKIECTSNGDDDKDFIVDIGNMIKFLSTYLPQDDIIVDIVTLDSTEVGKLSLRCLQVMGESFGESLSGKVACEFNNTTTTFPVESPRHALLTKSEYGALLNEVNTDGASINNADSWEISVLKENLSKLIIDNATKNIYISAKQGKMFALGRNQLSMFNVDSFTHGFILDVSIAKSVIDTISKMSGKSVNVYTTDGGKYITFVDEDFSEALWVCGSKANKSDMTKVGMFTNNELQYKDYYGNCARPALMAIVNASISGEKSDAHKVVIGASDDSATEGVFTIEGITSGGSIGNKFDAIMEKYGQGDEISEPISGTVIAKTLKDILSACKEKCVMVRVQVATEYCILRIADRHETEQGGEKMATANSIHYTMINTNN